MDFFLVGRFGFLGVILIGLDRLFMQSHFDHLIHMGHRNDFQILTGFLGNIRQVLDIPFRNEDPS